MSHNEQNTTDESTAHTTDTADDDETTTDTHDDTNADTGSEAGTVRAGGTKARTAETPEDDPRGSDEPTDREAYVEESHEFEPAPEGFEAEWSEKDTQVPADPVVVDVDGLGKASAKLVAWDVVEDMQDDDGTFGAEQVAKIIRDHYHSPSFSGLRADGVRNMRMDRPDALLGAIMPGMDTEVQGDGSAQVDSGNR